MEIIIALVLFVLLVISTYWYVNLQYQYWKRLNIPSVPVIPPFGSQLKFFTQIIHEVEIERYKKYGRIYGYYEGMRPALTVSEPELLKSIYVKDFQSFTNRRSLSVGDPITDNMVSVVNGEKWKRLRTIITPAFTTGKIKRMTSIILESASTLAQNFDKAAKANEPVDAKKVYGAFTMDVIASAAFGTKVDSHNDPENEFVTMARNVFTRNVPWRFILFILFPGLMKLLRISVFSPKGTKFFKDATLNIVKERQRTGVKRNDFLQLMMDSAGEMVSVHEKDFEEDDPSTLKYTGELKGLSRDELVANSVIFFLAGFDTTASTLAFASYELALNPECQERLFNEIDEAIARHKGKVTYEGVQEMKYLDNVVSETLRMHPPAIRLERQATEEYALGDTGLVIPKGMIVGTPVYAMHYDPEFFPEPEKFNPDRFEPENKSELHAYTYLPFGQGPRNCVGMRFALMEIKICLAHTLKKFKISTCPGTQIPLKYYFGQGLLQPQEILLRFEPRD